MYGWFDMAINKDDWKFKILASCFVKLATQFVLANNDNPLGPVIWWLSDLKTLEIKSWQMFANVGISCG